MAKLIKGGITSIPKAILLLASFVIILMAGAFMYASYVDAVSSGSYINIHGHYYNSTLDCTPTASNNYCRDLPGVTSHSNNPDSGNCNLKDGTCWAPPGGYVYRWTCDEFNRECADVQTTKTSNYTAIYPGSIQPGHTVQIDVFNIDCNPGGTGWICDIDDLRDYITWYSGDESTSEPPPGGSCTISSNPCGSGETAVVGGQSCSNNNECDPYGHDWCYGGCCISCEAESGGPSPEPPPPSDPTGTLVVRSHTDGSSSTGLPVTLGPFTKTTTAQFSGLSGTFSITYPETHSGADYSRTTGCDSSSSTSCTGTMPSSGGTWYVDVFYETPEEPEPEDYRLDVVVDGSSGGSISDVPDGAEINCGSNCNAEFIEGTNVYLEANTNSGYDFDGYNSGDCDWVSHTGRVCRVEMNDNRLVRASFVEEPSPEVSSLVVPDGGNYVQCGGNEPYVTIEWDYDDPEGYSQRAVEIRISGAENIERNHSLLSGDTAQLVLTPYTDLEFGTTYNWDLRVRNTQNRWSDRVNGPSFRTGERPPYAEIERWEPESPEAEEEVTYYAVNSGEEASANASYEWDLGEGAVDRYQSGPVVTTEYNTVGDIDVSLTVSNSEGLTCTDDSNTFIDVPFPDWEEVTPFQ